jgi:hypothetical protein
MSIKLVTLLYHICAGKAHYVNYLCISYTAKKEKKPPHQYLGSSFSFLAVVVG